MALRSGQDDTAGDVFTVEQSHGKPRLTRPRLTDLGTVPTDTDRSADHGADGRFVPRNQAAVGRTARTAIRAPYAAAARRIKEATEHGVPPSDTDALLADALAVYGAARAELGVRSVFVQGPTIAYAVETVLAGFFMRAAADTGFLTERGLELHERAMACETQAARAMTAALAATKALTGRRPKRRSAPSYLVDDAEENE